MANTTIIQEFDFVTNRIPQLYFTQENEGYIMKS